MRKKKKVIDPIGSGPMYLKTICLIETLVRPLSVKALTTCVDNCLLDKVCNVHAQIQKNSGM